MDSQPLVVYCTCPDQTTAERIAEALVIERLAACANIVPGLISIFRWQGQIRRDPELLLILKTREAVYSLLEGRIRAVSYTHLDVYKRQGWDASGGKRHG